MVYATRVIVIREVSLMMLYRQNSDWWLAQHLSSNDEGLVPSNYVIEDSSAPEAQEYVCLCVSLCLSSSVCLVHCSVWTVNVPVV